MKYLSVVAVLAASMICTPTAEAANNKKPTQAPVTACDRLSGMPIAQSYATYDSGAIRYQEGSTVAESDALIAACREAFRRYPNEPRFPFRLGLALRDRGATREALESFAAAQVLGSIGGYDEAAILLFLGNNRDRTGFMPDGKAALAIIDEGIAKTSAPVLRATKAQGLLYGPQDIRDVTTGVAILRDLTAKQDVQGMVMLADWLNTSGNKLQQEEGLALFGRASGMGSGYAAARLAALMRKSDAVSALKYAQLAAKRENKRGLVEFGFFHEYGWGTPPDMAKARELYQRAALMGHAPGQRMLGFVYKSGKGVPVDFAKAAFWFERASDGGDAEAMVELALMYEDATGVSQDWSKARALYENAMRLGNVTAINNLAYMYQHGNGVSVDFARAKVLFEKAIAKGSAGAANNLGFMYYNGEGMPQDLGKAFSLFEKAAEGRNGAGTNMLGRAYLEGNGTRRDFKKAEEMFRKATDYGSRYAPYNLADMIEKGIASKNATDDVLALYKKSAERGYREGMYSYAFRLFYDKVRGRYDVEWGYSVPRNGASQDEAVAKEILDWLTKSVAQKSASGVRMLADFKADGFGVAPDAVEATRLFREAAETIRPAKLNFALRLRYGRGVAADPVEARRLLVELATSDIADSVTPFLVDMMDRGIGGPQDIKLASILLDDLARAQKNDVRESYQRGKATRNVGARLKAQRLAAGIDGNPDPAKARSLLAELALGGDDRSYTPLGMLLERGEGGETAPASAAVFYRLRVLDGDALAASRLALLLRDGRGVEANRDEARKLLDNLEIVPDHEAQMAYVAMLDSATGAAKDPARAAWVLSYALLDRNPAAIALLRDPRTLSAETHAATIRRLQNMNIAVPAATRKATALIDVATAERFKAMR